MTLTLALCCAAGEEAKVVVRVPLPDGEDDPNYAYFVELLRLACEKSVEEFGPYEVQQIDLKMPFSARGARFLKQGREIDVLWMPTTVEREKDLLPVRVPLLKGLPGCRVFLIRQNDQERFARVKTMEELRKLTAGQAQDWPDAAVLRANGIAVTEGRTYETLFTMLKMGRFDFFPRSICCVWGEGREHAADGLTVETSLLIYYPSAIYFFVSPQTPELAKRLDRGLRLAVADGSFDKVFDKYHGKAVKLSGLEKRRVFRLANPLLPKETPVDDAQLWLRNVGASRTLARE